MKLNKQFRKGRKSKSKSKGFGASPTVHKMHYQLALKRIGPHFRAALKAAKAGRCEDAYNHLATANAELGNAEAHDWSRRFTPKASGSFLRYSSMATKVERAFKNKCLR